MSDPIEPTTVQLSGERTDGATPPPQPPTPPSASAPDFVPPPRRETPPPPAQPPAAPPPPPPAPPASGGPDLPEPHEWWRRPGGGGGGGVATMAPPAPAPVTYVTNHYYPAAPAGAVPARFSVARLRPGWNASALVAGLLLVPVTGKVLHVFGDEYGVVMAALLAAGLLELRHRGRSWLVRVLTCNLIASSAVTAAGLHMYGYIVTGV
ncbi:hypothetical protein [Kitasatospora aburaviensis]|uniref:Integral membrane protein n=1 Tax=Kitasatospora aburaviensis TaxID=67265 RepID=A0ABW1F5N8_9ACTN